MRSDKAMAHRFGMGCWQLGGPSSFGGRVNGYGVVSEGLAVATVEKAWEQGVRFFDTADTYGRGRSEKILGAAVRGVRDEAIICTKFGAREDEHGAAYSDFSGPYLDRAIDASLTRLGTGRIDILLLHGPPDDMDWERYDRGPLEQAVSSGRIGAYGISAKSIHGARNAVRSEFGKYVEVVFNVLDRRVAELHTRTANTPRIIARVPLASGFLTDRVLDTDPVFAEDDIRSTMPQEQRTWMLDAARSLSFLRDLPGGMATSALRYVLHHPSIHMAVPGMRSPDQVVGNRTAFDLGPLPADIQERIAAAVPEVFHRWR